MPRETAIIIVVKMVKRLFFKTSELWFHLKRLLHHCFTIASRDRICRSFTIVTIVSQPFHAGDFPAASLQPFAKPEGTEISLLETKKAVPSFDGTARRIAGNNLN